MICQTLNQQLKALNKTQSKNERNSHAKATMRTAVRKAELALENKDENTTDVVRRCN